MPFLMSPILCKHHLTGMGLDSQNNESWRISNFKFNFDAFSISPSRHSGTFDAYPMVPH